MSNFNVNSTRLIARPTVANADNPLNCFIGSASGQPGATPHVPGTWVEVFASTPEDFDGLWIRTIWEQLGTSSRGMWDLAVGAAGSEVPILESVIWGRTGSYSTGTQQLDVPYFVPKGSRIAVRSQLSVAWPASEPPSIAFDIRGRAAQLARSKHASGLIATYGADRATTSGFTWTGIYGLESYREIVASAPFRVRRIVMCDANGGSQNKNSAVELAIGAASSEIPIAVTNSASYTLNSTFEVDIPKGERVSYRGGSWFGDHSITFHLFG